MLSRRLKQLREDKQVLQKDVAKHIGVSERVYGFYEAGRFPKDEEVLKKLSQYFNVSVDYLVGNVDNPEYKLIPKSEWPKELIESGIEELPILKEYSIKDLTMEDLQDLIEVAKKIKERHK
ncbi:MAG: helix-turn-helix transcriptional regulator [Clostridiaceae bacterium]|jgi:transcriptional regulator with XRE-family HTH domain|nr:helix-turn-helix transcriptional regulator [Clostridiaceae bacterium]